MDPPADVLALGAVQEAAELDPPVDVERLPNHLHELLSLPLVPWKERDLQ